MRASGYATHFKIPRKQTPSRRMWIIAALCLFLPPVGLLLLWAQARNPVRGKLFLSVVALLSMTIIFTLFLNARNRQAAQLPQIPPDFRSLTNVAPALTPTPEPSGAPSSNVETVVPARPQITSASGGA